MRGLNQEEWNQDGIRRVGEQKKDKWKARFIRNNNKEWNEVGIRKKNGSPWGKNGIRKKNNM